MRARSATLWRRTAATGGKLTRRGGGGGGFGLMMRSLMLMSVLSGFDLKGNVINSCSDIADISGVCFGKLF